MTNRRTPGVLAILGELRETILERGEVGLSKTEGLAQGIGLVDISLKCVQRIDVVERAQLIEPQDVAVHELRTLDEIADQTAALGNLDAVGFLSREDGGVAVLRQGRRRRHAGRAWPRHRDRDPRR